MYGPKPRGFWTSVAAANGNSTYQFLIAGHRFQVIKPFIDYAGHTHLAGEEWMFLGFSFSPYDDGLSWFVTFDNVHEWQIPMQWRNDQQGGVIDQLKDYVQAIQR